MQKEQKKTAAEKWALPSLAVVGIGSAILFSVRPGATGAFTWWHLVACGVLMVVLVGVLLVLDKAGNYRAGYWLIFVFGIGLVIMGGVGYSYKVVSYSRPWQGIVYLLAFVVAFGSVIPACFIFAKRFGQNRRSLRMYSIYSLLTGVLATFFLFVLSAVRLDGNGQTLFPASLWQALLIVTSLWQTLLIVTVCLWIGITAVTIFFSSHGSNAK